MQRRTNRDDFKQAVEVTGLTGHGHVWAFADGYEILGDQILEKPALDEDGYGLMYPYYPLEDAPDLFLKFARLYEEVDFQAAALEWCHRYGMLHTPDEQSIDNMGTSMPLLTFRREVARAHYVLAIYEAVLNRDKMAARTLLSELGDPEGDLYHPVYSQPLQKAIQWVRCEVMFKVQNSYLPMLLPKEPYSLEVKHTWYFLDLLGAMYLQMYWLMASNGKISRCEYCARIISLTKPYPDGRKRRRDKRFCDDACRQAHHRVKRKT
ncbi:MAG: hypothetical protein ACR2GU_01395 [Rubrobacteraceae bacterium]